MSQHYFRIGECFELEECVFSILGKNKSGQVLLSDKNSDEQQLRRIEELRKAHACGELTFLPQARGVETPKPCTPDLISLSEDVRNTVLLRHKLLIELEKKLGDTPTKVGLGEALEGIAHLLQISNPPSVSTVLRYWTKWVGSGRDIHSLIPQNRFGRASKFEPETLDELSKFIERDYLVLESKSANEIYSDFCDHMDAINELRTDKLKYPSKAQFYRILDGLDKYEVMRMQKGKKAADDYYRVTGAGPQPKRILERVEADHTPFNCMVFNPETGKADGRPWVTILIDVYSRMPLGIYVGFEPPSELSVILALQNAILPKTDVQKSYPNVLGKWLAFGTPAVLVCDNGSEFHSMELRRVCSSLNIDLQFCAKRNPNQKGTVERFLGSLNRGVCDKLPGKTFGSIAERGDYQSEANAVVTLEEARELIHSWIIDVYCKRIHSVTQFTPDSLWSKGLETVEPVLPKSKDYLSLICSKQATRIPSHRGVLLNKLFYNSDALGLLRRKLEKGQKVTCRYDREDLGQIFVLNEATGEFITVPCIYPEYAQGLTLVQHNFIRSEIKEAGLKAFDKEALRKGRRSFNRQLEKLSNHRLLTQRRKAARLSKNAPSQPAEPAKSNILHELDRAISVQTIEYSEVN